jgi:hypothetical protein
LISKRLCQEFNRTCLYCLHRHRDVPVPGNENNRNLNMRLAEFALNIQAAWPWQPDIKNVAAALFHALIRRDGVFASMAPTPSHDAPTAVRATHAE